jgi:hypothetical protein
MHGVQALKEAGGPSGPKEKVCILCSHDLLNLFYTRNNLFKIYHIIYNFLRPWESEAI